eukprot:CAMPEP_0113943490 /NCGR_PEP_ID=MMETSP1339-20121228/24967_1 /TAXON_ID=94617 /ORGANISM="Fibrocapsa japonica" /LENGTH=297 /DNA_ID=CAMNT_0000948377 /DNA_START=63 /DNA_END=952 /DNA_ORIENTATION=+ /assembly_acc=CAM_ASM_000762
MATSARGPFIDIGANLLDTMFQGNYHGSSKHEPDMDQVLQRSWDNGLEKIIITAGHLDEVKAAMTMAGGDDRLFCTVGVHPTRCALFEESGDPDDYMNQLMEVGRQGKASKKVVAIGEFGLDFDRTEFCNRETQLQYFEKQFCLSDELALPLFLHNRNTGSDFVQVLSQNRDRFQNGVVHSFDGTWEEAEKIIELGLYIGINGCSLKTQENIDTMCKIPLDRLMLETDCPWCEVKRSHAGFQYVQTKFEAKKKEKFVQGLCVKSRYEPCHIIQVAEVVAGAREVPLEEVISQAYQNT